LPEHLIERDGMQEKLHPNGVSRTNLSAWPSFGDLREYKVKNLNNQAD